MNIEALEYFKKIAEVKSISKVSLRSHISQSALSQMIQKLEDSIGYNLFSRSNKGVELTKMGEVVYEYADNILKTYQKMQNELTCLENNQCHVIINSTWAISNYSIPCLLVEVKKQHPNFNYELRSNRSEDIISNVENNLVDFGIIYGNPNSDQLKSVHFGNEGIVLVANKDFEIPEKITVNELLNYNLINFKQGCYNTDVRESITKYFSNFNTSSINPYDCEPLLSLDSISAVKSSVSEGFGISFLPYSSVKKDVTQGRLKLVEIENISLILEVNIIYLNSNKLKFPSQNVIDLFLKLGSKSFC